MVICEELPVELVMLRLVEHTGGHGAFDEAGYALRRHED